MESKEQWKEIKGSEGYMISNFGRVKSLSKLIRSCKSKTGFRRTKEKFLKPTSNGRGYMTVMLGAKRRIYIHRAVLEAFMPEENIENLDVNHKDFNVTNNKIENLEWSTRSQNIQYSRLHGRHRKADRMRSERLKKMITLGTNPLFKK